ncbi:MAG: glucuronate isomerase [Christensenellaceae bacterium]|jgi:glucuronate isomerase|nr:glucuronate isomerase [Christensenellaceae bacterium]
MSVLDNILKNDLSRRIYQSIKDLPILDYHCHLEAKDILEDIPFTDISDMWLKHDHYKWRLMRRAGVDERLIYGNASKEEKFRAFANVAGFAFGNPVQDWANLELSKYFGIDLPLCLENADAIRSLANSVIQERQLSPRKLLEISNVEYLATTDDPITDLKYHIQLADEGFKTIVKPTFRVDRCFNIDAPDFWDYVVKLTEIAKTDASFDGFLQAVRIRAKEFKSAGCQFSDVGVEGLLDWNTELDVIKAWLSRASYQTNLSDINDVPFKRYESSGNEKPLKTLPAHASVYSYKSAKEIFDNRRTSTIKSNQRQAYLKFMTQFWLDLCYKNGFTVQMHLGVLRNVNKRAFKKLGADTGFDAATAAINTNGLRRLLSELDDLPNIILYVLNPTAYHSITTIAESFPNVSIGVPWWFNDHKRGLFEYFEIMSDLSHIGCIPGMTTDGRSYLSYARHDYFRAILASFLSRFEGGDERIMEVAKAISYGNMKKRLTK